MFIKNHVVLHCSLTVRNEDRGDNAGRPTHTTKMESIQVIEECQNPTADEILSWAQNFDKMMKTPAGRNLFREFLRTEYSEENLLFWLACEDLKKEQNKKVIEEKARLIYEDYISILSPKEVKPKSIKSQQINKYAGIVEEFLMSHTFSNSSLFLFVLIYAYLWTLLHFTFVLFLVIICNFILMNETNSHLKLPYLLCGIVYVLTLE
uniref:RGS domain-containing protein n=1 Tax=Pavo cristatus TaxID=9049 RepID=A0A8C9FLX4_PAVCR